MELRSLGTSGLRISPLGLGCWPIAGMSSPGVTDADSLATIESCLDLGINLLDTAHNYGIDGESERLIGQAVRGRRDKMVIATKGGLNWDGNRKQIKDASPATLRRQCELSLQRLKTDHVDLLYLHAPDPKVSIAESAGALKRLMQEGKTRSVGASNLTLDQMQAFAAECPLSAYQPSYSMLDRGIEAEILPWCLEHNVSVLVYWPLMKGLLAGKLRRDHEFAAADSRRKYPMFQGDEWQKNHDLLDRLREIASRIDRSVAQLVLNWTIHRPGITAALVGAKRPDQIRENAGCLCWELSPEQLSWIDEALMARGKPVVKSPV